MVKAQVYDLCKRHWEIPKRAAPKKKKKIEGRKMVGHSSWMEKLKQNIDFYPSYCVNINSEFFGNIQQWRKNWCHPENAVGQESLCLHCHQTQPLELDKKSVSNLEIKKHNAHSKLCQILFPDKLCSCGNTKKISFFLAVLHESLVRSRDVHI